VGALFSLRTRTLAAHEISSTSVNIVNNSAREIRNVYTSHVDSDDWGNDLLGEAIIASGHSVSVDVSCDQQQVQVIAEDQDGCFEKFVASCGASSTWTITDETARDCGQF
jgi:hypothetical protein